MLKRGYPQRCGRETTRIGVVGRLPASVLKEGYPHRCCDRYYPHRCCDRYYPHRCGRCYTRIGVVGVIPASVCFCSFRPFLLLFLSVSAPLSDRFRPVLGSELFPVCSFVRLRFSPVFATFLHISARFCSNLGIIREVPRGKTRV